MIKCSAKELTLMEWIKSTRRGVRTLSVNYLPESTSLAHKYEVLLRDLVSSDTYVAFYRDDSNALVAHNSEHAKPMRLDEWLSSGHLDGFLKGWYKERKGVPRTLNIYAVHCSGCDRRIIIDGAHRVSYFSTHERLDLKVQVIELSALRWPKEMPDMEVICACDWRG